MKALNAHPMRGVLEASDIEKQGDGLTGVDASDGREVSLARLSELTASVAGNDHAPITAPGRE
jgi:hypothetical protein